MTNAFDARPRYVAFAVDARVAPAAAIAPVGSCPWSMQTLSGSYTDRKHVRPRCPVISP